MLAARIITGVVLLPLILWLIHRGGLYTGTLVWVATVIALVEYGRMALPSDRLGRAAVILAGALIAAWACFRVDAVAAAPDSSLLVTLLVVLLLGAYLLRPDPIDTAAARLGLVLLGLAYVALLVPFVARLRTLPGGAGWVYLALVLSWGSDTAAYFAGRIFGRRKLYEKVSPKKTVEGAVGGVVVASAGALALWPVFLPRLELSQLLVLASSGAAVGQVGDLVESMLKRSFSAKDAGGILPGHGGMLDRIDALMFVAAYLYLVATAALGLRP